MRSYPRLLSSVLWVSIVRTLLKFPNGDGYFVTAGKGKGEIIPALTIGGFTAIGSGAHFALGAMEHKATALQAARIARKRATDCGLPLHYLKLGDAQEIKTIAR